MSFASGTDAQGRILLLPEPRSAGPFVALLDDARVSLGDVLGARMHSLYVYGSVARGTARAGQSDLDLTLVLQTAADTETAAQIEATAAALRLRHADLITKVDIDPGVLATVLAPAQRLSWGYWLKHHCRCLAGEDLAARFAPFAPSREIALAVNADYDRALREEAVSLRLQTAPGQRQQAAARRLIRATNVLRAVDEPGWPITLRDYVDRCVARHPDRLAAMHFFLAQAHTPDATPEVFVQALLRQLDWMQQVLASQGPAGSLST